MGKPTAYEWPLANHTAFFLPWPLVLALFLLPRNRNVNAWLALLSTMAAQAVAALAAPWGDATASEASYLWDTAYIWIPAMAGVWLLSGGERTPSRGWVLIRAMLFVAVAGAAGSMALADFDLEMATEYLPGCVFLFIITSAALIITLRATRRRRTPWRLLIVGALVFIGLTTLIGSAFGALMTLDDLQEGDFITWARVMRGSTFGSATAGLVAFLPMAPMLWLSAVSPHWRRRWAIDFSQPSAPPPAPATGAEVSGGAA